MSGIRTLRDLADDGSEEEKEFAHRFARARGSTEKGDAAWYAADNDWTRLVGILYKERHTGYRDAEDQARKALEAIIFGVRIAGPAPKK